MTRLGMQASKKSWNFFWNSKVGVDATTQYGVIQSVTIRVAQERRPWTINARPDFRHGRPTIGESVTQ